MFRLIQIGSLVGEAIARMSSCCDVAPCSPPAPAWTTQQSLAQCEACFIMERDAESRPGLG